MKMNEPRPGSRHIAQGILAPGDEAEVVKWSRLEDTLVPITRAGRYISHDRQAVRMLIGGKVARFNLSDWELCLA